MKKRDLRQLALMGLTGGLLLASQPHVDASVNHDNSARLSERKGSCGASSCGSRASGGRSQGKETAMRESTQANQPEVLHPGQKNSKLGPAPSVAINEKTFRDSLTSDTKQIFDALDSSGKMKVIEHASKTPTRDRNEIVKTVRDQISQQNSKNYRPQK